MWRWVFALLDYGDSGSFSMENDTNKLRAEKLSEKLILSSIDLERKNECD